MATYLVLQNTYHTVELALFKDSTLQASHFLDKMVASKLLIPELNNLLQSTNQALHDLDFIGVNQGPGPFTTLRVVITTANGLAFATGIPLIGVDGLDALIQEFESPAYATCVALLNAFNNDVYFGIKTEQGLRKGVQNIVTLTQELINTEGMIQLMGNGAQLYHNQLQSALNHRAVFTHPQQEVASINQIGLMALHARRQGATPSKQLQPLYLKSL